MDDEKMGRERRAGELASVGVGEGGMHAWECQRNSPSGPASEMTW
jgi:hypothetical protein